MKKNDVTLIGLLDFRRELSEFDSGTQQIVIRRTGCKIFKKLHMIFRKLMHK